MKNYRKIAPIEKLYRVFEKDFSPLVIQFVFGYQGAFPKNNFKDAVMNASKASFSSRYRMKNSKYFYDSLEKVPIHFLPLEKIDKNNLDKTFIFKKKIDLNFENACEIYILGEEKTTIVFRVSHSVMDAQGAMIWIRNIFLYLKNKELVYENSNLNIQELSNKFKKIRRNVNFKSFFPKTKNVLNGDSIHWEKIEISNNISLLTTKLAKSISDFLNLEKSNFMIPCNVRDEFPNLVSTGNLALPLFLEFSKDDTLENINKQFLIDYENKVYLNSLNASFFRLAPYFIYEFSVKALLTVQNFSNFFINTGIISTLDTVNSEDFSLENFVLKEFYSIPPQQPLAPFDLVVTKLDNKINITIGSYEEFFPKKKMKDMMSFIEKELNYENFYNKINIAKKNNFNDSNLFSMIKLTNNNIDSIALYDENSYISYKRLFEIVEIYSYNLITMGIKAGDKIIIYGDRSFEFIYTMLALIKINAIFIPIDKVTEIEKLKSISKELNNPYIIGLENFGNFNKFIEYKDLAQSNVNYKPITCNERNNNIIYEIFTSGSTGTPKGVLIKETAFINYLNWGINYYNFTQGDCFPLFTSLSVDLTLSSIFFPLLASGKIRVFKNSFDLSVITSISNDKDINCIKLTPTHLKLFCASNKKILDKKLLIVGGENFPTSLGVKAKKIFGNNIKIVNEYGPTETTVACAAHIYSSTDDNEDSIPIGLPIDNTKILILNNQKLVPPHNVGELYVSGTCLAKGYENNNFNSESFFLINNEIFYKTGDLVRLNKNYELIYLGRKDRQIKINGNRVELEEIENLFLQFEKINSINLVATTKFNTTILAAFYQSEKKIERNLIYNWLSKKIPSYMIPRYFIYIDKIPFKTSGKIDEVELIKLIPKEEFSKPIYSDFYEIKLNELIYKISDKNIVDNLDSILSYGLDSLDIIKFFIEIPIEFKFNDEMEKEFLEKKNDIMEDFTIKKISKIIRNIDVKYQKIEAVGN